MDKKGRAVAATLLSSFFWGSSFPVIDHGVTLANPIFFLFIRFLFAAPLVLVVMWALKEPITTTLGDARIWGLGLLNAAAFMMQYIAQTWTAATNVALMINMYLIFVAIGAVVFLKERFSWTVGIAVGLGLLGVVLLETDLGTRPLEFDSLKGDLLALAAGLVWSVYIIMSKRLLTSEGKKRGLTPMQLTGGVCIATLVPLIFVGPVYANEPVQDFGIVIALAAYLAVFTTLLAYLLWNIGLKALSATVTSILILLEVAFAALLAYVFIGERLSTGAVVGGLIICSAALIATVSPENRSKKG